MTFFKKTVLLGCKYIKSQNFPESKNTWFWEMLLDSGTCFVPISHGTEINFPGVRNRSSMEKFGHFLSTEKILFLSLEDTFGVIVRLVALKFNSTTTTLFQYSGLTEYHSS